MSDISPLRFWCQKVLPLVYDDSLSYYEVICKVAEKTNEIIQSFQTLEEGLETTIDEKVKASVEKFSSEIEQIKTDLEAQIKETDKQLTEKYNKLEQDTKLQIASLEGNIQGRFDEIRIQLDGDITNWEANFEGEFNQTYQNKVDELENNYNTRLNSLQNQYNDNNAQITNFLESYEVKQDFGDSETAAISQNAITDKIITNNNIYPAYNIYGDPSTFTLKTSMVENKITVKTSGEIEFFYSFYNYYIDAAILKEFIIEKEAPTHNQAYFILLYPKNLKPGYNFVTPDNNGEIVFMVKNSEENSYPGAIFLGYVFYNHNQKRAYPGVLLNGIRNMEDVQSNDT